MIDILLIIQSTLKVYFKYNNRVYINSRKKGPNEDPASDESHYGNRQCNKN